MEDADLIEKAIKLEAREHRISATEAKRHANGKRRQEPFDIGWEFDQVDLRQQRAQLSLELRLSCRLELSLSCSVQTASTLVINW